MIVLHDIISYVKTHILHVKIGFHTNGLLEVETSYTDIVTNDASPIIGRFQLGVKTPTSTPKLVFVPV